MQLRKLQKKNQSLNINEKKLTIQLPFHKVSYYYFTKFADEKVCTHKKKISLEHTWLFLRPIKYNIMRKKLLSLGIFVFGALCANAEMQYMVIEQKTGEKFNFLLDENPIVTYEDGNLVVNGNASTTYAIGDVKNYHFTETSETGVDKQLAESIQIENIDESTILIKSTDSDKPVTLYAVNGAITYTTTTNAEGKATVSLPKQGVYVLTIGKQSIKLIRK